MRERINEDKKNSEGRHISSDNQADDHSKPRDVNNFNTTVSID
jgi:hypothetical protein